MKKYFRILVSASLCCVVMSCHSLTKDQRNWIYEELPLKVWDEVCLTSLKAEYIRLIQVIGDYEAENLKKINEERLDNVQYWLNLNVEAFAQLANESFNKKGDNYSKRCSKVLEDLVNYIPECYSYRDSAIVEVWNKTDKEICEYLVPYPQKSKKPDVRYVAVNVAKCVFKDMKRPVVSACEYDKEHKCWVVRFDNADTHYVRFLKRDDGGFDTEYSSEIFD